MAFFVFDGPSRRQEGGGQRWSEGRQGRQQRLRGEDAEVHPGQSGQGKAGRQMQERQRLQHQHPDTHSSGGGGGSHRSTLQVTSRASRHVFCPGTGLRNVLDLIARFFWAQRCVRDQHRHNVPTPCSRWKRCVLRLLPVTFKIKRTPISLHTEAGISRRGEEYAAPSTFLRDSFLAISAPTQVPRIRTQGFTSPFPFFRAQPVSPPLPADAPQLNFGRAESFLTRNKPTLEAVRRQGGDFLWKVNPDGNCYFGASTTGALLFAVCQPGPDAIRGVFRRFRNAIELSGKIAFSGLSEDSKVSFWSVDLRSSRDVAAVPRNPCLPS